MRFIHWALLILLISISTAEPDVITVGPYNVSFDIGLNKSDYETNIWGPIETETLQGDAKTDYEILIEQNNYNFIYINVGKWEKENIPFDTLDIELLKEEYEDTFREADVSCYERPIDGTHGSIAYINWDRRNRYITTYQPTFNPEHIWVYIDSTLEWNKGTLKFLKTIHVTQSR